MESLAYCALEQLCAIANRESFKNYVIQNWRVDYHSTIAEAPWSVAEWLVVLLFIELL